MFVLFGRSLDPLRYNPVDDSEIDTSSQPLTTARREAANKLWAYVSSKGTFTDERDAEINSQTAIENAAIDFAKNVISFSMRTDETFKEQMVKCKTYLPQKVQEFCIEDLTDAFPRFRRNTVDLGLSNLYLVSRAEGDFIPNINFTNCTHTAAVPITTMWA